MTMERPLRVTATLCRGEAWLSLIGNKGSEKYEYDDLQKRCKVIYVTELVID